MLPVLARTTLALGAIYVLPKLLAYTTNKDSNTLGRKESQCFGISDKGYTFIIDAQREVYDEAKGLFTNNVPLHKYSRPDGKVVYEYVQETREVNDGRTIQIFLALKDEDGKPIEYSLWSDVSIKSK